MYFTSQSVYHCDFRRRALRPGRRSWDHAMCKSLFLQAPSFDGFDGGAGSRYQAKREIRSFWFPAWLAQPAALVPESRVLDAPADELTVAESREIAPGYDLIIRHTTTPPV